MFPSWMRPTKMLAAAVAACLLLLAAPGLHHGGAAARAELVRAQAGPVALRIDANHRATTDAVFTPGERIAFWYNLPDGGTGAFLRAGAAIPIARADGTLDVTFTAGEWDNIPLSASSIVAYGIASRVAAVYLFDRPVGLDLSLRVDANHRATTDAIFAVNEPIVFWYNLPDGSARSFAVREDGFPNARPDGTLDVTIGDDAWRAIPADATSLVAHGLASGVNAVYVFNR